MDGRFVIYNGFKEDAKIIFADLIRDFNFDIVFISDLGLRLRNNRCELQIQYETGFQVWLFLPKYNVSEMLVVLSMFKGDGVFNEYLSIWSGSKKEQLQKLCFFLIHYFTVEIKE